MSGGDVELDPVSLEDRLRVVCGHLNVLHAELVALTAEALATGVWQVAWVRSPAQWLSWQAGLSPRHAGEIVELAGASVDHPAVLAELGAGGLSLDQAAVAASVPAYLDAQFAELATVATVSQLRTMARAARPDPTPTSSSADAPDEKSPVESFVGWFGDDGRYRFHGELAADHGRLLDQALSEARDALFHAGHPDVDWPAALVELAHRSLDTITSPQRRERFRANWFIDPTDPVPARWIDGLPVPAWLRDLLTCDGTVAPVFTDGAHPVSVGRTQRVVPDRTRRLVLFRDRCCRVPWCTQHRWLQVHHIIHDEHHGPTDTWNLASLCPAHHRLHHHGQLGITGNADEPDGLTFTDRHGHPVNAAARPTKPTRPPPPPARPYEHPLGEPLDRTAVMFPDPPPATAPEAAA
jgi:hypothetical protein